ncbi:MAG: glycosyltransferase [Candidatus Krumholzibacteriota bacterium]|nr:glycosyltransferase [Candidatus Krumholzibacteriota bacterium]
MNSPSPTLKVFFLASTLVTGGAEKVVQTLVRGLPEYGIAPEIICLRGPGRVGEELREGGSILHAHLTAGPWDPSAFFTLKKLFGRDRGAVLFCLDHHNAIFWGALCAASAGLRHRVLGVHSTGLWDKGGTFSLSDRMVLSRYQKIIALAPRHAEYMREHEKIGKERIVLIYNGVDIETFRPVASGEQKLRLRKELSLPPGDFVVTIAAALRPEKNHRMFIRAAARVIAKNREITFLVAGSGGEEDRLRALAAEMPLGDRIRFLGLRDDIPRILSASDLLTLCSFPVVETFPLVVLEAMATGIPVVATAVGSIPDMLREGEEGILIPSGDEAALAAAWLELSADRPRCARIGAQARQRVVKDFSDKLMIRRYAELFRELTGRVREGE